MSEKVWKCKIGGDVGELPSGSDLPMRKAVSDGFYALTGRRPSFIFSGWGAELTEPERAVVENRLPQDPPQASNLVSLPPMDSDEAEPILRAMERAIRDMARVTPLVGAQYAYEAIRSFMPRQGETPAEPDAWMSEDGRLMSHELKTTLTPRSAVAPFTIPLYRRAVKTSAEGSL